MVASLVQENENVNNQFLSNKSGYSSVSLEELKNSALKALNNEHTPAISNSSLRPDGSEFKVLCHSVDVSSTNAPDLVFVIAEVTNSLDDQGLSISLNDLRNSNGVGLEILTTNNRGEITKAFPDSDIYAQIGLDKNELAQFAFARFEAISNNTVEQQVEQFKHDYPIDSIVVTQTAELGQEALVTTNNSNTWIESLKSQVDIIDGSKIQIFSGKNKVYEQTDNVVTLDKLETTLGEKVQQALDNPNELKGSVRIVVDGEKVYHAKDGEVIENKHFLTLDSLQVSQEKSLEVIPEIPQVIEAKEQTLQVNQEKSLEFVPEIPQVIEIQKQDLQTIQETSLETVVSQVPQFVEDRDQNLQVALPEPSQSVVPEKAEVNFVPPPEIVMPVKNEQVKAPTQGAQPISSEPKEKAIFELIARQDARINQLEQKLAAQTQPLNITVNQWLGAINQTAKSAVQQVKQKSLHIPQNVRSFIASKASEIKTSISEQVKTTRTHVVNKVNESVTAARTEVIGKVNEVKSSLERQLADVAGKSLNASTRYLAERFGVDNGSGIKVFQGNSLVITSSVEHSGIYSKDGKQLVKDGQFVAPVTSEQLNKIAQIQPEAQKLSQSQSQSQSTVRAKALR